MAKYYGTIGYGITVETAPGVWKEQITGVGSQETRLMTI